MKVLLIGGYAGDGWISIARYQRELLRGLQNLAGEQTLEAVSIHPEPGPWVDRLSSSGPVGRHLASYWTRFFVYPRQIPQSPGVIYHLMDQSLSYLVRVLPPDRTVVTCHDLLRFPLLQQMRRRSPWPWASDRLYRYCVGGLPDCAAIISVSQRNKEDAVRYLGCDPNRIHVAHEGTSSAFRNPVDPDRLSRFRSELNLPAGQVLIHVGVPTLYKNVEGLLRGVAVLRQRFRKPFCLLRVGPFLNAAQRRLASELGITPLIREVGTHQDDTLPLLYHLSDCLVFPSLYEGFGLPPLEAMACGVPVITSDRGSLPEVVGEAALQVNPEDPDALADAMQRVLEDSSLRQTLRARGLERCRRFSWEDHARKTAAVYRTMEQASRGIL